MREMIHNYLKVAFRSIRRNSIYTLINIVGLTTGIAVALLIFVYVYNELQYDKAITKRDRIYRIEPSFNQATIPSLPGNVLMKENSYCERVVRVYFNSNHYSVNHKKNVHHFTNLILADSSFFSVFDLPFILGNPRDALKAPNSLVITESQAKIIFGNENPLGQVISVENRFPFTITGVIKDPVHFHLSLNGIGTLETLRGMRYDEVLNAFDGWDFYTYVLGRQGLSAQELEKKVNDKLMEYDYKYFVKFRLTCLKDLYLAKPLNHEGITSHGNRVMLFVLVTIALFLLFIAWINFINITTARASIRAKEVGIRKVAGAKKRQLVFQFILETFIIMFVSLFIAIIIIETIQSKFSGLIGKGIDFDFLYSPEAILILIVFSLLTSILAGAYPAFYLSSYKPVAILKSKSPSSNTHVTVFRKAMIVFQYFIAIVLIACTLIVFKQLNYLKKVNLGFEKEHLIYIKINDDVLQKQDMFKSELLKIPEIKNAAYSSRIMGVEWGNWQRKVGNKEGLNFQQNYIDPDYFKTMGIQLVQGRNFSNEVGDYCLDYIINETAIKDYNLEEAIGLKVSGDGRTPGSVIGFVKDVHFLSPKHATPPVMFYYEKMQFSFINIRISSADISSTILKIKKLWKDICPSFAFEYHFLDDTYDSQYKSDELFGKLIGIGSLLAILIACLGILGLAVSSTENHTKEIGVRKVNGATTMQIVLMLSADFIKWVVIAFIFACPIAYYAMYKWLQNFAYKTEISWWVFALAGIIATIIALTTVSWQSWRVANGNPVEGLKYE